jgi:hypothetical protein
MYAMPNGDSEGRKGYSVCIGSKTEHPLGFLKAYIDKDWECVSI